MNTNVSIIIPSYNSAKTIKLTLDSILKLKCDYIKEVIVVDSSEDSEVQDIISKYNTKLIKFINAGIRVMPAIGRNIGASKASGDLFVFLDSDVLPAKDLLENFIKAYRNGCLAVAGSIELPDFQKRNLIARTQYYLQVNEYIPHGVKRIIDFPAGCNVFCERKIFEKIGGYPESRAAEDVLFGFNINRITPLWFLPDAKVAHIFKENWSGFLNNQRLIGKYVAIYRKQLSKSIVFKGIFPIILFPVFYLIKINKILPRITKLGLKHFKPFITILPIFFIGVFFWTFGFVDGCLDSNG